MARPPPARLADEWIIAQDGEGFHGHDGSRGGKWETYGLASAWPKRVNVDCSVPLGRLRKEDD